MATVGGPKIIRTGLVLNLDTGQRTSYSGTGTFWKDLSSNNNGTVNGSPTFSSSNGGFFTFDAINDYVDCGNGSSINFGTGDFTVEIWALRTTNATTNLRLLSKGGESDLVTSAGFAFFGSDTGMNFIVNPSGARTSVGATTHSVNEWFQVVGIVERASTMRIYKNAALVNSATAPAGSVSNASLNLNIGRNVAGNNLFWSGNVAIVRMYNKALSNSEIRQNYNTTKRRFGL